MSEDARFRDAQTGPLRLRAFDAGDLEVISGLVQDSVFPGSEMTWQRTQRRFGLLLNRFRWEDPRARDADPERVRCVLAVEGVLAVRSRGIDQTDGTTVHSLLSIAVEPGEDGAGVVTLILAGGGAVALDVEALEVTLRDVTRPYHAPSGKVPHHDD